MILKLQKRDQHGKNKVDKLRQEGLVPGVVYSKGEEAVSVTVVEKDLVKAYEVNGLSNIFKAELDGAQKDLLIKEIQKHPFKNQILHFDAYLIDMNQKIRVTIPVVLEGRDNIKAQPSVIMQIIDSIEIECLPGDLPSEAVVNVVDMQIGDNMTVADLDIASNDKIHIHEDLEEVVAVLSEPQEENLEEETDGEVSAEVPTVAETEAADEE